MLSSLYISNYALIDELNIEFGSGLNIITGETGAGKSIVLGALSLIMGERADLKTVRSNEKKTVVEARFALSDSSDLQPFLDENGIDSFGEECIMRRELTAKGTSRAFINDTPVNLSVMKTFAEHLLDIHTQHENLLLNDPAFQLEVIDSLAGDRKLLDNYREAYETYRKLIKRYTVQRDNLKRDKAESEYNKYLLEQLDLLDLQPGEQEELEKERDFIANAAEIKAHLTATIDTLSRAENDVLSGLSAASAELGKVSEYVKDSQSLSDRLNSARIEIADIVDTLLEYDATIKASEADLYAVEQRLGQIYALQSRHNVSTDTELIELRKQLREKVNGVANGDDLLAELEEEAKNAKKKLVFYARDITKARTDAALKFAEELRERAMPMGMKNLRCEIRISPVKPNPDGMDNVEFLFAFNKNQALMPIGKTASGGEIARVILAIKSILVDKMRLPTIIFDEVDTGVSGDIANRMAKLMLDISRHTQVITITHIATVAAHGKRHFKVYKRDSGSQTNTCVRLLTDEERPGELAFMISGNASDPAALQTAISLLKS